MSVESVWFTFEETQWLISHFLYEFVHSDYIEEVDGNGVSTLNRFLTRVISNFKHKFPYRHPSTDVSHYPQEIQKLQVSSLDAWQGRWLIEKFRNRLEYLKTAYTGPIPNPASGPSDGGKRAPPDTERTDGDAQEQEPESLSLSAQFSITDAGGEGQELTKLVSLPSVYTVPESSLSDWADTLANMQQMATSSWAQCQPRELRRRRDNLATNVRHLLHIIAYATGCEMYATGVMASHRDHRAFHTTSPRSSPFLQTQQSICACKDYAAYISQYIGESLCVSRRCPGPAIIGDLEQDGHPLPPSDRGSLQQRQTNLATFFSHKLRWQGGGTEVPYDLLGSDAKEGQWRIVTREVLPNGVSMLRDPLEMDEAEIQNWTRHLHAGCRGELNESRMFQFAEPRPGLRNEGYQWRRSSATSMAYGPDSLSYARIHLHPTTPKPTPRPDRLPNVHTGHSTYNSISPLDIRVLAEDMGQDSPIISLLQALQEHDTMHPYQAVDEDWITIILGMPYLKLMPPGAIAFIDHLHVENGWLPWAFFDGEDPNHQEYNLTRTLAWCAPHRWRHGMTRTLIGGNVRKVQRNESAVRRHYGPVRAPQIQFEARDIAHMNASIHSLARALRESTRQLASSLPYRLFGETSVIETRVSDTLHARLKIGTSGITWFEPVLHDDPWHERSSDVINTEDTGLDVGTPTSGSSPIAPVHNSNIGEVPPTASQPSQPVLASPKEPSSSRRVMFVIDGVRVAPGESTEEEKRSEGPVTRSRSRKV